MFFDQKIHPLNFDYPDTLMIVGDTVELTGAGMRLRVGCDAVAEGCLRLRGRMRAWTIRASIRMP